MVNDRLPHQRAPEVEGGSALESSEEDEEPLPWKGPQTHSARPFGLLPAEGPLKENPPSAVFRGPVVSRRTDAPPVTVQGSPV